MFVVAALLVLPAGWIIISKWTRSGQLAADGDWKYVQLRRVPLYLEESLYPNVQWVVFEPNGQALQRVRLSPDCSGRSVGIARQ